MKIKASAKGDVIKVKMLIAHIMETGRRKDADGKLVPGHYITEVTVVHKDTTVFHAQLGPAVSKDPYLAFAFKGGVAGDKITVSWIDNKGETETSESVIR